MVSPFTPLILSSGKTLKNRLVMAPMTTQSGNEQGQVKDELVEYYRSRAKQLGAVIVECAYVQRNGVVYPGGLGLENDEQIAGLKKISQAIKEQGSVPILQIYHGGRMVLPSLINGQQPVSASAIAAPRCDCVTPRALTTDEIEEIITNFGATTKRAIEAGFEGVEIHGANTYLIQQFFSPHSNQRNDCWGGTIDKRAKFPLTIVDIVKETVKKFTNEPFVVGYRFSPEELEKPGITFDDTLYLLEKLAEKNLDYLHFSTGSYKQSSIIDLQDKQSLIAKLITQRSEKLASIPIMGVGGVKLLSDAEKAMQLGYDLVSVGKALIIEPDWVNKIINKQDIKTYIKKEDCKKLHVPESIWDIIDAYMTREEKIFMNKGQVRKEFLPGVYREAFVDFHGMVNIDVTLDKVAIKKIDILTGKSMAPGVSIDAFAEMSNRIVQSNDTDVDVITGATESCQSMIEAVERVIAKATGEPVLKKQPHIKQLPWLDDEPTITTQDIIQEIHTDVIVVGCGVAGVAAVRAAAEENAKVVVIEKADSPQCRSGEYAIINGQLQERWGRANFDPDEITDRFMRECSYKIKRPIISRWAKEAANIFDWFIAAKPDLYICDTTRSPVPNEFSSSVLIPLFHPLPEHYDYRKEEFPTYPTSVSFVPDQSPIINANMDVALATGNVTTFFGHFAEKLLKEGNKVIGVIARDAKSGKYIKVLATKGVILATGDYASNKDILDYYCPEVNENGVRSVWLNRDVEGNLTNTGDGLKLGARIGALIQQNHAPMIHHMGGPSGMGGPMGITPFLFLNKNGERFMNEDVPGQQLENQLELQPERRCYQIFDSNWKTQLSYMPAGHGVICYYDDDEIPNNPKYILSYRGQSDLEQELEQGNIFTADSIDELLSKLDINQTNAKASIERYNVLAKQQYDADFNKTSSRLFEIGHPPYYAVPFGLTVMLVCCGGLESDENCHTFDEERNIIDGLYVAGNIQGNRYAVEYPICMKGISHSLCMFYGYIAGKNCVNKK